MKASKSLSMAVGIMASAMVVSALALSGGGAPQSAGAVEAVSNVAKDPTQVPASPLGDVTVNLVAKEVVAEVAPGIRAWLWTFALADKEWNVGKATVPGPMIRIREGNTLTINLRNDAGNIEPHNIDLHASMGPGGGAAVTNVEPGETKTLRIKATRQGAYIYHCAGEGMPWEHVSYGMYGLIQVDSAGGLPPVDYEFYVGQSDWYLMPAPDDIEEEVGQTGFYMLDEDKALAEHPDMFTFNGHKNALTDPALFGETIRVNITDKLTPKKVRVFFVTGGPNIGSNWHIIGQIFDRVYTGKITAAVENEETVYVAPGSAAVFELTALVPGKYLLVDHALWRVPKGAAGFMWVDPQWMAEGDPWPSSIYYPPAMGSGH